MGIPSGAQAYAVVGDEAKDGQHQFTAKLDIGGKRACTGALVESQWVLTAASCFADDPSQGFRITGGAPKLKTVVTVGRTDLSGTAGTTVGAVELVPRGDRDLVMVKLAKPVTGVTPVTVAADEPRRGEDVRAAGYGRTKEEWAPDRLHSAAFGVTGVSGVSVDLAGKNADAALCKGDTGSPAFREKGGGKAELVAINSAFWQGGCWGTEETEVRKNATSTRVDDAAEWVQATAARDLLARADWKNAAYTASGYFTGPAGGKRYMDLFVVWKDGSASLYQGSSSSDPKTPFSAEHKIAKAGSVWQYARAVAGGDFAGDGRDGLFVRWKDGEVTEYAHLDEKGVHGEKKLQKGENDGNSNPFWKNARLITAGRFSGNDQRDDVLVLWENGSTSMYTDVDSKGLSGHVQLSEATKSWENATQISAGDFTGKKTSDLLIQWQDGETSIFPGVDTKGYHGRTKIRDVGSAWKNMQTVTTGSFANSSKVNDVLITWNNGNVGIYPAVDADGTHGGIELVS
ncbi:S1 family peptidase [Streptomyces sp. SCA3-4]|nr:S1 family peptidase [Streptomyces sichuanensis]